MMHLVLGGARSGKSTYAENIVNSQSKLQGKSQVYIATAMVVDDETKLRISLHQQQRKEQHWQTIEVPFELPRTIASFDVKHCYLIDCLTMWLNNIIFQQTELDKSFDEINVFLSEQREQLIDAIKSTNCSITIVSNEVGLGIIPMGQSTRLFVDHLGWLNQQLAAIASEVTLITAGIVQPLKVSRSTSTLISGNLA